MKKARFSAYLPRYIMKKTVVSSWEILLRGDVGGTYADGVDNSLSWLLYRVGYLFIFLSKKKTCN